MRVRRLVFSVCLVAPSLVACAGAEEAIFRDGRSVPGKLLLAENRLQFLPAGQQAALPLDQLNQVRFPEAPVPTYLGGTLFHVSFVDGQRVTGEILTLDDQDIGFRTPWGLPRRIPRQAVRALTQPHGYLSLVEDDFESDLHAWQLTGAVSLDSRQHVSGKHSLFLNGNGQAARAPAYPLAAGRAGINFFDAGHDGARGLVELVFQCRTEARSLRVVVGGDRHYGVVPAGTTGELGRLTRSDGWHHLTAEFAPEAMRVYVDDRVLWSGRVGPAPMLTKVRLACVSAPDKGGASAVWFDDFTLARAVDDLRREDADPRQDEVWLASGDQLLGRVARADRRSIELDARFGKRTLSWGDVRGLYLRKAKQPSPDAAAGQTRLWLRAASGGEFDQLVGQVRALSDSRLTLRHALLGDLEIERGRLRRIAPLKPLQ